MNCQNTETQTGKSLQEMNLPTNNSNNTKSSNPKPYKVQNLRKSILNLNNWLCNMEKSLEDAWNSTFECRDKKLTLILSNVIKHQNRLEQIVEIAHDISTKNIDDHDIIIINEYIQCLSDRFKTLQLKIENNLRNSDLELLIKQNELIMNKIQLYQSTLIKYNTEETNSQVDVILDTNNCYGENQSFDYIIMRYTKLFAYFEKSLNDTMNKINDSNLSDMPFQTYGQYIKRITNYLYQLETKVDCEGNALIELLKPFRFLSLNQINEIDFDDILNQTVMLHPLDLESKYVNAINLNLIRKLPDLRACLSWRDHCKVFFDLTETCLLSPNKKFSIQEIDQSDSSIFHINQFSPIIELTIFSNEINSKLFTVNYNHYINENISIQNISSQIYYNEIYKHTNLKIDCPIYLHTNKTELLSNIKIDRTIYDYCWYPTENYIMNLNISMRILTEANSTEIDKEIYKHFIELEEYSCNNFQKNYEFQHFKLLDIINSVAYDESLTNPELSITKPFYFDELTNIYTKLQNSYKILIQHFGIFDIVLGSGIVIIKSTPLLLSTCLSTINTIMQYCQLNSTIYYIEGRNNKSRD